MSVKAETTKYFAVSYEYTYDASSSIRHIHSYIFTKQLVHHSTGTVTGYFNGTVYHGQLKLESCVNSTCFRTWLQKNIEKSHSLREANETIRSDIEQIQEELVALSGVERVGWRCSWGDVQRRSTLRSLRRLLRQHGSQLDLKGFGITFTDKTGVSSCSQILLSNYDVPEVWIKALCKAPASLPLLNKSRAYDIQLSRLLRNANIMQSQQTFSLVETYLQHQRVMTSTLERYFSTIGSTDELYYNLSTTDLVIVRYEKR